MKKLISLLIIGIVLTGCVSTDSESVLNSLKDTISKEESKTYNIRVNNITNYVDYYMPSDLAEEDYDDTTFTFSYNEATIVYNINIADIINNKYYADYLLSGNSFFNEDYLLLKYNGVLVTAEGDKNYVLEIYQIEDNYLISFYDVDSQIYAYSMPGDARETLRNVYILAKTAETDHDKIIADYSDKDVISSTKKTIDLFSYVYPSSGYLSDLVKDSSSTGNSTAE